MGFSSKWTDKMLLASVQFRPDFATSPAEVKNNIRRCEPLIHQAWMAGVEFLVFPELFATGYSFLNKEDAARVCEKQDGPTFRYMSGVAQELKSYLSWGYVESDGSCLYNSASMVDPDGKLVSSYRKINLFSNDFLWSKPGESPAKVVKTDLGNISVVVCRDLRDRIPNNIPRISTRIPRMFDGKNVDIVAACVNWGKGGFPATQWMDFASDNGCTLVLSNRWGSESNGAFSQDFGAGGSIIIEPDWTVHTGGLKFGEDCLVTALI